MSPQRPQPRRSALSGVHPAIPATEETVTKPAFQPAARRLAPAAEPPLSATTPTAPESRSEKITLNIPASLISDAKDAYWADRGTYRTFSEWVGEALQRQIQDTMSRHRLRELPPRPASGLPPGRPLS